MGRGRQKAMAKKIAQEVKYSTQTADYDALMNELQDGDIKNEFENLKTGYEPNKPSNKIQSSRSSDLSEEELADYLEWAKSSNLKKSSE